MLNWAAIPIWLERVWTKHLRVWVYFVYLLSELTPWLATLRSQRMPQRVSIIFILVLELSWWLVTLVANVNLPVVSISLYVLLYRNFTQSNMEDYHECTATYTEVNSLYFGFVQQVDACCFVWICSKPQCTHVHAVLWMWALCMLNRTATRPLSSILKLSINRWHFVCVWCFVVSSYY